MTIQIKWPLKKMVGWMNKIINGCMYAHMHEWIKIFLRAGAMSRVLPGSDMTGQGDEVNLANGWIDGWLYYQELRAASFLVQVHTKQARVMWCMNECMNILPRAMSRILPGPGPDKAGQGDEVRQGDVGIKRLLDIPTKQRCQAFKIRSRTNQ